MASDNRDPIAAARANWERSGWGDVSLGMVAVTSVMRAHQILLARVETALRPYDLSFSRFELLRLLAFSRIGALPITKASDRLQVHVTSVTHAIRRLEADGLVRRVPHPTDGRTTLVQITELGRSTVEDATVTPTSRCSPTLGWAPRNRRRWCRPSKRCGATPATFEGGQTRKRPMSCRNGRLCVCSRPAWRAAGDIP
ncbi:MarR family transcriptional regulator [Mycobacterium tuberculosis CAS/NITR204]|uniref:MarR family transcriptional regulator n=2 Tax=Bacteria TaxID=2 RepID=R4M3I5_MYCTX|nr:MarR family transcriptional regulator [Mycobacterium tuberculosis CAS/NITR204]